MREIISKGNFGRDSTGKQDDPSSPTSWGFSFRIASVIAIRSSSSSTKPFCLRFLRHVSAATRCVCLLLRKFLESKFARIISFCIPRARAFILWRDFHRRSHLDGVRFGNALFNSVAFRASNGKRSNEERERERENASRFTRRNSDWRVYNGETSRIIKRNANVDVTHLDGGKLDVRG
jgi:membrane protein implicated in regulation of membrane protease activity